MATSQTRASPTCFSAPARGFIRDPTSLIAVNSSLDFSQLVLFATSGLIARTVFRPFSGSRSCSSQMAIPGREIVPALCKQVPLGESLFLLIADGLLETDCSSCILQTALLGRDVVFLAFSRRLSLERASLRCSCVQ